jgi:uncharacterized membrane protein YjjP (DUF1212 family)
MYSLKAETVPDHFHFFSSFAVVSYMVSTVLLHCIQLTRVMHSTHLNYRVDTKVHFFIR